MSSQPSSNHVLLESDSESKVVVATTTSAPTSANDNVVATKGVSRSGIEHSNTIGENTPTLKSETTAAETEHWERRIHEEVLLRDEQELTIARLREVVDVLRARKESRRRLDQRQKREDEERKSQNQALKSQVQALKSKIQVLETEKAGLERTLGSRKYRRKGATIPTRSIQWADESAALEGFTDDVMGWWKIPLVLQQDIAGGSEGVQAFVDRYNATKKRASDKLPVDVRSHSYFVCLCGAACNTKGLKNPFVVAFPVEAGGGGGDGEYTYAPGFARYDVRLPDGPRHAVIRHLRKVQAPVTNVPVAIALREPWVISEELQGYMDQGEVGLEACLKLTLNKVPKNWKKKTYFFCQCEVCNNNDLEHAIKTSFLPSSKNGFEAGFAGYGVPLPVTLRNAVRDHLKLVGADFSKLPVALRND